MSFLRKVYNSLIENTNDTTDVVKVVYKIYLPFSLAISALFFVTLLVFVNICFSLPSVLRSARVVGWGVVTEI